MIRSSVAETLVDIETGLVPPCTQAASKARLSTVEHSRFYTVSVF